MNIIEHKENEKTILEIDGRLDTATYAILEKKMTELVDQKVNHVLIDLEKMDYISSSGLRVLLMFLKKLGASGGKLVLANMQPNVKEIFDIAGFTSIFEIQ